MCLEQGWEAFYYDLTGNMVHGFCFTLLHSIPIASFRRYPRVPSTSNLPHLNCVFSWNLIAPWVILWGHAFKEYVNIKHWLFLSKIWINSFMTRFSFILHTCKTKVVCVISASPARLNKVWNPLVNSCFWVPGWLDERKCFHKQPYVS